MQFTYLAISRKPQEAVAWSAVQPSLSQASISAPCCTRNVTMSRLSSMHACRNIMKIMTTGVRMDVFYTFTQQSELWLGHTARERNWDRYRDQMESTLLYGNVHTSLRQETGPEPIVSYCASPVPCTGPSPFPVQCG